MTDLILDTLSEEWPTWLLFGLCVGLFVYAEKQRPPWQALAVVASYAIALVAMSAYGHWPSGTDEQLHVLYEVWATGKGVAMAASYLPIWFVAFVLFPPPKRHGLIMLFCLMVIIAELWTTLAEDINCNFWQTDIPFELQTEAQKGMSKCERVYGWWYRYVPLAVQIGMMFIFVGYYKWAKGIINGGLREVR